MIRNGLLALAAFGLAGCASAAAPSDMAGRDCFRARSVTGYQVVDDHTVQVRVGTSRRYNLTMFEHTRGLDAGIGATLRSQSGFVCEGEALSVELIGGQLRRSYGVSNVTRVADEPARS